VTKDKQLAQYKESEEYARAEIARLEAVIACEEEAAPALVRLLEGQYSNLAQALYQQVRLSEAREATLKGLAGWKEAFLIHIDKVQKAVNCVDFPLCKCQADLPFYQRFSLQDYGGLRLLQCPKCGEFFALTVLPEQLNKIRSGRIDLAKNKDASKSTPDEAI